MKLDLKEWINKVMTSCVKSETFTANADGNGFIQCPTSLNGRIPIYAETTTGVYGTHYFFRNPPATTNHFSVRFKNWNDAVLWASTTVTVTVWYVGGVVRKLIKALKPLTLGRGWAV